jgi:ferredoxin
MLFELFTMKMNDQRFLCPETISIVEAGKIQNARIPYGCNGGGCGICKARVVEGKYRLEDDAANALSDEEQKKGHVFLCKTYPLSDLQLELIKK